LLLCSFLRADEIGGAGGCQHRKRSCYMEMTDTPKNNLPSVS
jgi:hypothetical protein